MNDTITLKRFADIDLNDTFFNTLKEDYPGFEAWFQKKSENNSKAYVQYTDNNLQAFLYLKDESGEELTDVTPTRPACNRLKVGTFKIDAHNTKLGERFVKKIVISRYTAGCHAGNGDCACLCRQIHPRHHPQHQREAEQDTE